MNDLGAAGVAALTRYDDFGDPADLTAAVDALSRAVEEAPDDPDRLLWVYGLGLAHGALAEHTESVEHYDAAVGWREALIGVLDPDDPDRDELLVHLADLCWDRSWAVRYDAEPVTPEADLERLVGRLAALRADGIRPTVRRYLRLLHGMALAERADPGPAIDVLAPAWTELTDFPVAEDGTAVSDWVSPGRLAFAGGILGEAYRRRAEETGDIRDLDRAAAVLRSAIESHGVDPVNNASLHHHLAWVHQQRWEALAEDGDLDAAIAACEHAGPAEGWDAALLGELLGSRAERTDDLLDARRAADLLRSAAASRADDPEGWQLWQSAAAADRLVWRLSGETDALQASAGGLDQALAGRPPDDGLLEVFLERLVAEIDLIEDGRLRPASGPPLIRGLVDEGHRVLQRALRAGPDRRAIFAGVLAYAEFGAVSADLGRFDVVRVRGLLSLAATARTGGAEWQALVEWGFGVVEHYTDLLHPGRASDGGLARLARAGAAGFEDPEIRQRLSMVLSMAGHGRASVTGDARGGAAAGQHAAGSTPAAPTRIPVRDVKILELYSRLMELLRAGDATAAGAVAREGQELLRDEQLSPTDQYLPFLFGAVAVLADPGSAPVLEMPEVTPGGLGEVLQVAAAATVAMTTMTKAVAGADLGLMRTTAAQAEALIAKISPRNVRILCATTAMTGLIHAELARRTPGDLAAAAHAAALYEQAMDLAGGLQFVRWAELALGRAEMLRLSGDRDLARTRKLGLSALQGHAWQVFGQSGTDHAMAAARAAAADARKVAVWCLADRDSDPAADDDLIAVLDAGRGLVLRATTTARQVADRLAAKGRHDLAAEWRATAGQGRDLVSGALMSGLFERSASNAPEVPDELRFQVLRELGGEEVLGYEPVTGAEIRSALDGVGADALVYLMPGLDGRPGRAVVVPVSGRPDVLTLPLLRTGDDSPVRRYARSQPGARDLGAADPGPVTGIDEVCEWAWDAAMGDLLAYAGRWQLRRPVRLVLVPMGVLGLVPWHAAFTESGPRRRYAVQDAVVSYSPSARTLCAAGTGAPTVTTSALLVGDPGGDLPFAGIEAHAIHRLFYRRGSYFGRPATAAAQPGSPQDVLHWIDSVPAGAAVLHFACHGAVDPARPADAHLVLAGGARLTARTLLERSQAAAMDVEQVFLAACTTSLTGDDHDEVLSLATAFLAAGSRTVFGSLWPVPDGGTALLMFMVHRFLRVDGCAPADALHRAQLWMLDRDRIPPAGMPGELLRQCPRGTEFGLTSWAGFVHLGR